MRSDGETLNGGRHCIAAPSTSAPSSPGRRLAVVALALCSLPSRSQGDIDASLRSALAGAHRSAANRARDAARHPFETLRFFGLQANQQAIEIAPGGGWYTEILAPYLRDHGRLYAARGTDSPFFSPSGDS